MSDLYKYFKKIEEGYLSVSPFFGKIHKFDDKEVDSRVRQVTMNLGDSAEISVDKKVETTEGTEIHLKSTDKGTQELKAYFFEDSKNVQTLTIQKWMTKTGNPRVTDTMVLYGKQLALLLKFVEAYVGIPSFGNGTSLGHP